MKYYLIAGEASGDLHGSNLMKALHQLDAHADIRCWGGDLMQQAGGQLVRHYRDLAFMGFTEVIKNLPTILKNMSFCKKDIESFAPDVLVLIDYPGFNLRMAQWAKSKGLKVVYYISPQVWAWKESRVKDIKKCVDEMLVILPFEKAFYATWNYPVTYVGHPLAEVIDQYIAEHGATTPKNEKTIALLPGSRQQEILKKLPIMLQVSSRFPDYEFVVAKAPGIEESFYKELLAPYPNVKSTSNRTYHLLLQARAAIVTSGTATLETALFGVPQIICYKGNPLSYQIAKRLIKIKFIGLVNLIMNKEVVKELIQDALTPENITRELQLILGNTEKQLQIAADYTSLKSTLQQGGAASSNAASIIYKITHPITL